MKTLKFSVPPGFVRTKSPFRPKLDAFCGVIDAMLSADKDRPKKQRHTAKRVFERLRDEHGFTGDHIREGRRLANNRPIRAWHTRPLRSTAAADTSLGPLIVTWPGS
jgi:hypothetical protein